MKIVIAPDSFKGTLSAAEVCEIIAAAFRQQAPDCEILSLPAADGGEGLCNALQTAVGGKMNNPAAERTRCCAARGIAGGAAGDHPPGDEFAGMASAETTGVFGEPMAAQYLRLPDGSAVIEMAACAGLPLAGERKNPETASTFGVGLLLRAAVEHGAKKILLGLGGSATNDCGIGMAAALGFRFLDGSGVDLPPVGASLSRVKRIHPPNSPFPVPVIAACDVDNPLYGEAGAAHVFAPQKGADAAMVQRLDDGLRSIAAVIQRDLGAAVADIPGAGAAGGLGAGTVAFLGGKLQSGIDIVLDTLRFDEAIRGADLVISGEGKLDSQSSRGKVISGVLARAARQNIPVMLLCGCMEDGADKLFPNIPIYPCGVVGRGMAELQESCRKELQEAARLAAKKTVENRK